MDQSEVLKYALENGILDLESIQKQIEMNKREELLKKHAYKIWEGSDGKWYTYIPDEEKKNNRRLIKRKTQKDIEDVVIQYVKSHEEKELIESKKILFKDLYKEWLISKQKHTNSSSYIKRITADWQKYYVPQKDFINMPIDKMNKMELDDWAHEMIKEKELTKKQYYNMSIIVRQSLSYAVERNYIKENPFEKIKINSKMFRKVKKPLPQSQVFLTDEVPRIVYDMIRRFKNDPKDTSPLAVLLDFEVGVRIGEIIAIRKSDISDDWKTIHIQRQVVREFEYTDDGSMNMKFSGFKVVEYTKSENGDRMVYLTDIGRKIIRIVLDINERYNNKCEDYIFVKGKKMISHYAVQSRILRGCETTGIAMKSMHKVRKTYISSLIDSGLNIDEIRRQVGHSDERTTYSNYCFNRLTTSETQNIMENALKYDNNINVDFSALEVIKSNQNLYA